MADVTFGVKVTPELKNQIEQYIKDSDFETNKEWFQYLLSIYDLHLLKQQVGMKRYVGDLDHIEYNLTRIQETIVEMMKKTVDEINHQEAEWIKASDELQQQLQLREQQQRNLESQLFEAEEENRKYKKELSELHKQQGILDDLCTSLKNATADKDTLIEALKQERDKREAQDYPSTVQRLTEDNHSLKQQLQNQQHQIDLIRLEYEKKLEMEIMRTEFAQKEIELLRLPKRIMPNKNPNESKAKRGPGRPSNKESTAFISGEQQITTDDIVEDDYDEQYLYMPDQDELQNDPTKQVIIPSEEE